MTCLYSVTIKGHTLKQILFGHIAKMYKLLIQARNAQKLLKPSHNKTQIIATKPQTRARFEYNHRQFLNININENTKRTTKIGKIL